MGRPREFDESDALERAIQLFWSRGFEATSMTALLDAMSLSRSSFYQVFDSKEAVFHRCIDQYADILVAELNSSLQRADSGMEFIRAVLVGVSGETRGPMARRGCLVMNTANEFGQHEPDVARTIARQTKRFEDVFYRAAQRAVVEGDLDTSATVRATARYVLCTLSGLKTMVKAGASKQAILDMANMALRAIAA